VKEGETEDFIYFAESCDKGCVLKIGSINQALERAVLSFDVKYIFL
jgi:hypothetical protein